MTDKEYYELIQPYEDAMKLLLTRLEVLNHSIYKTKTFHFSHGIKRSEKGCGRKLQLFRQSFTYFSTAGMEKFVYLIFRTE